MDRNAKKSDKNISTERPRKTLKNESETEEFFKKIEECAVSGDPDYQYHLATCYLQGVGVEKSVERSTFWMLKAADNGNLQAMIAAGIIFMTGSGVKMDKERGLEYIKKAAETGDAASQLMLGDILMAKGDSESKDEGFLWVKKASNQGYPQAMYELGLAYAEGTLVDRNKEEAVRLLKLAAGAGHEEARKYLENLGE